MVTEEKGQAEAKGSRSLSLESTFRDRERPKNPNYRAWPRFSLLIHNLIIQI